MTETPSQPSRDILKNEQQLYCFGDASYLTIKDAHRLGLVYWSGGEGVWRRRYPDSVKVEQAALEKAMGAPLGTHLRSYVPQGPAWRRRRRRWR